MRERGGKSKKGQTEQRKWRNCKRRDEGCGALCWGEKDRIFFFKDERESVTAEDAV